jgi:DNA-binding Xre family transcriptional regulator
MTIKSFWWAQRPVVAVSGVNISSLSPTQFLKLHSLIRRICRELDCDSENVLGLEGIKQ